MGTQCEGKIDLTSQTTKNFFNSNSRVHSSVSPGNYWHDEASFSLGTRRSAVSLFNAGYSVAALQQRLEEEDVIVMKRSLYRLIKIQREGVVATLTCREGLAIRSSLKKFISGFRIMRVTDSSLFIHQLITLGLNDEVRDNLYH